MLAQKRQKRFRAVVLENHRGELQPYCYLRLKTHNNKAVTVVYHSEFPPAVNFHAGDIGYLLDTGDEVEVFADYVAHDRLSTCEHNKYYIRKLR